MFVMDHWSRGCGRSGRSRSGLLAAACAASERPAPPLAPPPGLHVTIDHFAGTLLTGPLGVEAAARVATEPAQALVLTAKLLLLDEVGEVGRGGRGKRGERARDGPRGRSSTRSAWSPT
jgi:hypothetical protein